MQNKIASLLALGVVFAQCAPAFAQAYHKEYGGSRVIMQCQTGLYNPSATYIGSGTLSQSAQGKSAGVGGSLPAVRMGSTVRTPGDNLYNNDGTDRQGNGALIYQDEERAMVMQQYRRQEFAHRRQMMLDRQQRQIQQHGNFYMPGSNTGTATYAGGTPAIIFHGNGGAATYSDGKRAAVRQF
jgi:hypothetical protein